MPARRPLVQKRTNRRLRVHRPGLIAQWIGVDPSLEEECLSALARAGQIRRVRGKWRASRVISVDTRTDPEGNRRVKRHWAKVALQRLSERACFEAGICVRSPRRRRADTHCSQSSAGAVNVCRAPKRANLAQLQGQ